MEVPEEKKGISAGPLERGREGERSCLIPSLQSFQISRDLLQIFKRML